MAEPTARRTLTTIALAVPAALLAVGWMVASWRAYDVQRAQARRDMMARAEVVVAAVREGLEDLRGREDERPYYVYSYYYTPPDLIALQESVAVSPLGSVPTDARVRGHFQIDPGPRVHTPLVDDEAPAAVRDRGHEIVAVVEREIAPRVRGLASANREQTVTLALDGDGRDNNSVTGNWSYSNAVLRDIRAAQQGDPSAQVRAQERGRAPYRTRVTVAWNDRGVDGTDFGRVAEAPVAAAAPAYAVAQNAAAVPSARAPSSGAPAEGALQRAADQTVQRGLVARDFAQQAPATRQGPTHEAPVAAYTPMRFARRGNEWFLYRVVTTDGVSSVQGVLLDREVLRSTWLDAVLTRHAPRDRSLQLVESSRARSACVAAVALPAPLDETSVCARTAAATAAWRPLAWQIFALAAVLALIAASAIARERALRRARDLAGLERSFVASVSHELRTPLTTLRMNAEMLKEGWVSEGRREKVIGQLVDESARLSRLVEDVLTFGRLADGQAVVACEPGDLGAAVRDVVERERARLESRGVTLDVTDVREVRARWDRTAVDQITTNLLENAAKYAADATDRTVHVSTSARPGRAVLTVRDHGRGVAASERERVFDRFYRARAAIASHVAGTGLGLAIVRGLARAMGGDARIVGESEANGCVVEVELPLAGAPSAGG